MRFIECIEVIKNITELHIPILKCLSTKIQVSINSTSIVFIENIIEFY